VIIGYGYFTGSRVLVIVLVVVIQLVGARFD